MKAATPTCPACGAAMPAGAAACPACGHTATVDPFQVGDVVEGRYRIEGEVGRGGMGVVYRGTDLTLKRAVALKAVRPGDGDPELLARFLREARALASVEHPGLVPVYGVGREGGVFYMVMKFVEGETLAQVLKRQPRLAADRVLRLVSEVCEALAVLHGNGLVHRDLKPGNLIIGPDGRVTVMDLGIVKTASEAGAAALGTPRYMAPEMIGGREVDGRADVYALGVIAYQALSGAPPFDGPTPMAILYKAAHEPAAPLRERAPEVPRGLAAAVERALAKDPAQRYPDAASFAAAVRAAGGPRRPWGMVAAATALFLLGALGALLTAGGGDDPPADAAVAAPRSAAPVSVAPASVAPPSVAPASVAPPSVAPPSVAPPSVAPRSAPPAPAMVDVKVTSDPSGAAVLERGRNLGRTPLTLRRPVSPRSLVLVLRRDGYADAEVSVVPREDTSVHGKLDALFELVP